MDFKGFLSKLNVEEEEVELEDIKFEVVTDFRKEMFDADSALYVEMLEDNYHFSDIVGVAWGTKDKIYVTNELALFESIDFKKWLESANGKKSMMRNVRMLH